MRLKLTLVRHDGSSDDIVVTADASATAEDLAQAIAERDPRGAAIGPGRRRTLRQSPPGAAAAAWEFLPPGARIGEGWLGSGARIALAAAEDAIAPTRPAALVEALSGPQRGKRWSLARGTSVVGRGPACDVVLADPFVSGRHARVEVAEAIEVVDLGSANGIEVDGELPDRVSFAEAGILMLGGTQLRISVLAGSGDAPPPRTPQGTVPFNRSPRVERRYRGESFASPALPIEGEADPFPWLATALPLLIGVGAALLLGRPVLLLFALMSPVMALGGFLARRHRRRRALAESIGRFETHLRALGRELDAAFSRERDARLAEAPSIDELVDAAVRRAPPLWTRRPEHASFLDVRLGLGAMPTRSRLAAPARGESAPELQARIDELVTRFARVPEVPIVDNLYDAGAIGVAGRGASAAEIANGITAQLVGLHSPADLAVAAIGSPSWSGALDWLKWLPHASSAQSPLGMRPHLADTPASGSALLTAIEELVARRVPGPGPSRRGALAGEPGRPGEARDPMDTAGAAGTRSALPVLVVLVCDDAPVDRARLIRLAERGPDAGVYAIWIAPDAGALPGCCRTVVEVAGDGDGVVSLVRHGERIKASRLERLGLTAAGELGRSLAPMVDAGAAGGDESDLPGSVPFPELVGHELHEAAEAVIERWRESDTVVACSAGGPAARRRPRGIRALVGVADGAALALDLRAQGPHALVGGTTGSGKSEFLQAWVLGMALEQGPERVTFLLVDYKGGAAFADCVRLPHCVGLVTDLSPALVRRALTSLRAELRHREELLSRLGAKDLLELERRGDPEAPPALVLVIDELAALAKEVPEFLDGIVDIAQRGRSLGIHLVMATQRPAGVIRDDLRANTNLRIALRMADEADSRDVIGVADAAHLDPALPGRAMVRSGSGRPRTFQAAHTGGWTRDEGRGARVAIAELRPGPEIAWLPSAAPTEETPSRSAGPNDQQRLVASISRAAAALGIPAPRRPWLDELPPALELSELMTGDDARIPIGLGDDPARQRREPMGFRPDTDGHIAFIGAGGSGKSVALRSLAVATAMTPEGGPVHVYGLDFAGGGLRMLQPLPHVGSIVPAEDAERVERLLRRLRGELRERARRYSAASAASIVEYRRGTGRADEPRLLLLIDGFASFREEWELPLGRAACFEAITEVLASGRQLGIHIALSADRPGAVPASVSAQVQRRVVLRLADETGYALLGEPRDLLDEGSPPGRAIVDGLETQLAILGAHGAHAGHGAHRTAAEQAVALEEFASAGHDRIPLAPSIGVMPELVPAGTVPGSIGGRPVLGVSGETLDLIGFEPRGLLLLSGPPGSGRSSALAWLVESLRRFEPERTLVYLGHAESALAASPAFSRTARGASEAAALASELAQRLASGPGERIAVVVEGIGEFLQTPAEREIAELARQARRSGQLMIAESESAGWSGSWPLLAEIKNARRGLLLQPEPLEGELLLRTPLPRSVRSRVPPGRGVYVERGTAVRVQLPHILDEPATYPHFEVSAPPRLAAAR